MIWNPSPAAGLGYTVYSALITQNGAGAPTEAVVYTNTITGLTWSRFAAGVYFLTKAGAILANKIFYQITINRTITEFASGVYFSVNRSDNNTLVISTSQGTPWAATDTLLNNTPFELRIYP
jgi:hypothetical protein